MNANVSSMAGSAPEKERARPAFEYTAQAVSSLVTGEAKLMIGETGLTVTTLFDAMDIPFAKMTGLAVEDYAVSVNTYEGDYVFSRMGQWAQPFYDALLDAYNNAVLRSLFIKGNPLLTATGDCRYSENGALTDKRAAIQVYDNCVAALPADMSARRVPLCFVSGMNKGDYELTLRLTTGESYTFARLGYDCAPFADAIEKQIRKLRERSAAAIKEIAPSLTIAQASRIASLLPEGAAAPIGELSAIAPAFAEALEGKLSETRASESYKAFKEICDPMQIHIGFRKNEGGVDLTGEGMKEMLGVLKDGNPLETLSAIAGGGTPQENAGITEAAADPFLLWLIAPSPDGKYAAVEFAQTDAATFVYRTDGDMKTFARQLNRALEAISFKREVIRLTDDELFKPQNSDYFMANERTPAFQYIRNHFAGRAVHSGGETWKRKLQELWGAQSVRSQASPKRTGATFCGQCGVPLVSGVKFCGSCGASV